jgi:Phasin protein
MSKPSSRRHPNESRPTRRSLVELTALASQAIQDGLQPQASFAAGLDRAPRQELAAAVQPIIKARVAEPESASGEANRSDSTAELAVRIAKEFQAHALEDLRFSMNAALSYAKDLVEPRASAGDRESQIVDSLGAAAECRAESIKLAKANLEAALDYSRAFVHARTAAEFVELSSEHARKQCELILKQTSVLTSFARAVTKPDPE